MGNVQMCFFYYIFIPNLLKQMTIPFPIGTANPLQITDWQLKYADTFGNRPMITVTMVTTDELGSPCEWELKDVDIYRYPPNEPLERINIIYGDGVLDKQLNVTIK